MTEKQACFASPHEATSGPELPNLVSGETESTTTFPDDLSTDFGLADRRILRHSLTEHHLAVLNQRLLDRETTFL